MDLVVGIDFGTTCTGVAYISPSSGSRTVKWIQRWPGRSHLNETKVPTQLAYNTADDRLVAWGFQCEIDGQKRSPDLFFAEYFKIFLDPAELQRHQKRRTATSASPVTSQMVQKWFVDYLSKLYGHVQQQLEQGLGRKSWADAKINFTFSLPTTWTSKVVVETFRNVVARAGFGQHVAHHVDIGLTEAEAAAVWVSKEAPGLFARNDIMLMCDAGGGTTDLSVLRVESIQGPILSLRQLDVVSGRAIGSVAIDADFADLIFQRLCEANGRTPVAATTEVIHQIAWTTSQSPAYQSYKCEYGSDTTTGLATFHCPIALPPTYTDIEAGIEHGTIKITTAQFQGLFDKQISKLFAHLDKQIINLGKSRPEYQITHLIISGGFGNSQYVQQQLRARYEDARTGHFHNMDSVLVRVAPEPQLAVCKGLVEDRLQRELFGAASIPSRCCRESYGILCKVVRSDDSARFAADRQPVFDPVDQNWYYTQAIRWLVKKGEPVSSTEPIEADFYHILRQGDPNRTWTEKIMVGHADAEQLPRFMGAGVKEQCTVSCTLAGVPETAFIEGRSSHSKSLKHYIVHLQVVAIVGPADLRFELWFNGRRVSAPNAILVTWTDTSPPGTL